MNLSIYTKEFSYNWKLASPVMLGMLGHTFVSFVDNIMVGQLGTAELAAVSLGNSFMFVAMSIGIGFSTAITPLIAEADSSNNFSKAKSTFKHGLFLCTIIGISMFLLLYFSKSILHSNFLDQPKEVVTLAIPYLDLVAFSLIPLIIFQAFKQFSDGLSMTKYPMYATIIANIVNIILNYIFIFGKFGLISFDYSTNNYKGLYLSGDNFSQENLFFDNQLKRADAIRLGSEWRINNLSVRCGYVYEQSPFINSISSDNLESYSLGLGYNFGTVKLNLSYKKSNKTDQYDFYPQYNEVEATQLNINNTIITIGFSVNI